MQVVFVYVYLFKLATALVIAQTATAMDVTDCT